MRPIHVYEIVFGTGFIVIVICVPLFHRWCYRPGEPCWKVKIKRVLNAPIVDGAQLTYVVNLTAPNETMEMINSKLSPDLFGISASSDAGRDALVSILKGESSNKTVEVEPPFEGLDKQVETAAFSQSLLILGNFTAAEAGVALKALAENAASSITKEKPSFEFWADVPQEAEVTKETEPEDRAQDDLSTEAGTVLDGKLPSDLSVTGVPTEEEVEVSTPKAWMGPLMEAEVAQQTPPPYQSQVDLPIRERATDQTQLAEAEAAKETPPPYQSQVDLPIREKETDKTKLAEATLKAKGKTVDRD